MEELIAEHDALGAALGGAEQAAKVHREYEWNEAQMKSPQQLVTEADVRAEQRIKAHISETFPDHAFVGEEEGVDGSSSYVWHIDPIDGTTDFVYGLPHSSISIALVVDGKREVGVVHHPHSDTTYAAVRGAGAYRDDELISPSETDALDESLFGAGFSRHDVDDDQMREVFECLIGETLGIRRYGSSALNLCYAADGTFDGFVHRNLGTWDVAAGTLIVEEANGVVTNFDGEGGEEVILEGDVVATNKVLHDHLPFIE